MTEAGRPFEDAGLVAMSACGHWWTYPWRMTLAQSHDVVAFHAGLTCPFCETARDNRRSGAALPIGGRGN